MLWNMFDWSDLRGAHSYVDLSVFDAHILDFYVSCMVDQSDHRGVLSYVDSSVFDARVLDARILVFLCFVHGQLVVRNFQTQPGPNQVFLKRIASSNLIKEVLTPTPAPQQSYAVSGLHVYQFHIFFCHRSTRASLFCLADAGI